MALDFLEVNFLAGKQAEYSRQNRRLLIIQGIAFSLLVLYLLGLSGLFVYSLFLNRQKQALESQVKNVSSEIQDLSANEAKYLFIKTKLEALQPVLASQRKNQELVEAILTLLSPGVSVGGVNVTEDGNISFSGEAVEFAALAQFLANLSRGNLTPAVRVELAEVGGVSLRNDGGYSFSVVLELSGTETKTE